MSSLVEVVKDENCVQGVRTQPSGSLLIAFQRSAKRDEVRIRGPILGICVRRRASEREDAMEIFSLSKRS